MSDNSIKVVVPEIVLDEVASDLVKLTRTLDAKKLADGSAGGALGGEYGYGANFENETFMIHRYCWCEKEDCPWCGGDASPFAQARYFGGDPTQRAPNFWHKKSDFKVWWYKYIGRGMEYSGEVDWDSTFHECMVSIGARK